VLGLAACGDEQGPKNLADLYHRIASDLDSKPSATADVTPPEPSEAQAEVIPLPPAPALPPGTSAAAPAAETTPSLSQIEPNAGTAAAAATEVNQDAAWPEPILSGPPVPKDPPIIAELSPADIATPSPARQPVEAATEAAPKSKPATATTIAAAGSHPVAPAPTTPTAQNAPIVQTAAVRPDDPDGLIQRGDQLLKTGDIISARPFFERAAAQGSIPAATRVGETYDPVFLASLGVRGLRGDPTEAANWYLKAGEAGDIQAVQRLQALAPAFR
jgi:hypothetical protein